MIGSLRQKIILLKRKIKEQEDGEFEETWQEGDTVWAQVTACKQKDGGEGEEWDGQILATTYAVKIRFRKGSFVRIKWEDRVLRLVSKPQADPEKRWLEFLVR